MIKEIHDEIKRKAIAEIKKYIRCQGKRKMAFDYLPRACYLSNDGGTIENRPVFIDTRTDSIFFIETEDMPPAGYDYENDPADYGVSGPYDINDVTIESLCEIHAYLIPSRSLCMCVKMLRTAAESIFNCAESFPNNIIYIKKPVEIVIDGDSGYITIFVTAVSPGWLYDENNHTFCYFAVDTDNLCVLADAALEYHALHF